MSCTDTVSEYKVTQFPQFSAVPNIQCLKYDVPTKRVQWCTSVWSVLIIHVFFASLHAVLVLMFIYYSDTYLLLQTELRKVTSYMSLYCIIYVIWNVFWCTWKIQGKAKVKLSLCLTKYNVMETNLVLDQAPKPWRSMGEWIIAPWIFNLGTRWKWVVSFTPWPFYPWEKSSIKWYFMWNCRYLMYHCFVQ
jgi:hypothetical protein